MSKLFNIQDGGGNEMDGGEGEDNLKDSTTRDTIGDYINRKIDNVRREKLKNVMRTNSTLNIPTDVINKINSNEDLITYFFENRNNGDAKYIYSLLKGDEYKDIEKEVQPIDASVAQGATGETVAKETPGATPGATTGTPGSTGCIHIGIIDETGTFVGVKSISYSDSELFNKLKTIADELRATNATQINDAQKQPVATIYDKFVSSSDANCVPTFITGYETKFFNSVELKTLFDTVSDKEKLPFTVKTPGATTESTITTSAPTPGTSGNVQSETVANTLETAA